MVASVKSALFFIYIYIISNAPTVPPTIARVLWLFLHHFAFSPFLLFSLSLFFSLSLSLSLFHLLIWGVCRFSHLNGLVLYSIFRLCNISKATFASCSLQWAMLVCVIFMLCPFALLSSSLLGTMGLLLLHEVASFLCLEGQSFLCSMWFAFLSWLHASVDLSSFSFSRWFLLPSPLLLFWPLLPPSPSPMNRVTLLQLHSLSSFFRPSLHSVECAIECSFLLFPSDLCTLVLELTSWSSRDCPMAPFDLASFSLTLLTFLSLSLSFSLSPSPIFRSTFTPNHGHMTYTLWTWSTYWLFTSLSLSPSLFCPLSSSQRNHSNQLQWSNSNFD